MTDNEIIKELNIRIDDFSKETLDLINLQKDKIKEFDEKLIIQQGLIDYQKAEIERLKNENKSIRYCYEQAKSYNDKLAESCETNCKKFNMTTRAEAIKEFCEKRGIKYVEDDV